MARVFTVFNHGTAFHRDADREEVVTLLHDAAEGTEARIIQAAGTEANPSGFRLATPSPSYLICEGPGSAEVSAGESAHGVAHTFPGRTNPILNTRKDSTRWTGASENPFVAQRKWRMPWSSTPTAERMSDFRKEFVGETPSNYQATGLALGKGWDDNVYRLTWMLTHLKFEQGLPIDTINMVGWSRGAVTCIKQANKLHEVFGTTLKVNIFAIDPVPGGYNTITDDIRYIPPNVKDMLVVLAMDDDRGNFQPLDIHELLVMRPQTGSAPAPNVHFLPLPGNHGSVVWPTKGSAPLSGKLCVHLAHKFLQAHGTRFSRVPAHADMEVRQLVAAYESLRADRERIQRESAQSWNDIAGGRRQERRVRRTLAEYVDDPARWVNAHHQQCAQSPNARAEPPRNVLLPGEPRPAPQGVLHAMGITYDEAPRLALRARL